MNARLIAGVAVLVATLSFARPYVATGADTVGPTAGGHTGGQPVDPTTPSAVTDPLAIDRFVYQLQNYPDGRLDALAAADAQLAVIDLARDAYTDWFRADEVEALRQSGKAVLSYFEIGSIENFRPEYAVIQRDAPDLILNNWDEWPEEYFVKYWDERWWDLVVRPRLDRALETGFDGVYLDTILAYEEIPLSLAGGRTRKQLAQAMVALVKRMDQYANARRPEFWIVPQNSPELRQYLGYTDAIDGIGMEELFYRATDKPCNLAWCLENLNNTRQLRAAGKFVLAVDYAKDPVNVQNACNRYAAEDFAGYVTVRALNRITPSCGQLVDGCASGRREGAHQLERAARRRATS